MQLQIFGQMQNWTFSFLGFWVILQWNLCQTMTWKTWSYLWENIGSTLSRQTLSVKRFTFGRMKRF